MQVLNGSGLKLWLYLNKNQNNYKLELSRVACAGWGIKKDSYYAGVEELVSKGYLVPIYVGSNIYKFYEKAIAEKPKEFSEIENRSMFFQKTPSDFPERNNTNITKIKQNKTFGDSYSQKRFHENAFAVGESGGSGKAATAHKDNYERFGDMPQEKKEYLASLGF